MSGNPRDRFLALHRRLARRYFLGCGVAGALAMADIPLFANDVEGHEGSDDPSLRTAIERLDTWLTRPDDFRDVSRGKPLPHSLSPARRTEVGLTRETWKLQVVADPEHKPRLGKQLTTDEGTALTFPDLMQMAKQHAVRFPKVMTCLNIGCPLGNGIWEGIPLRSLLWLTQPRSDVRRVYYYGYHNDDPQQMFRSSLPVGRVLEDLNSLPPVIVCYKLNGQWLTPERGGPVRVVVPEAYGFKSIKWLSHVVLSNRWQSNDTYGEQNNDVDSPLKTFCETIACPTVGKPNEPIAVTGYAQVGISGLTKVQTWLQNDDHPTDAKGPGYASAPWRDARILPVPDRWGGGLPDDRIPPNTLGFDTTTGRPTSWPVRLSHAHWATLLPGVPAGNYTLRCRTMDANGVAQPMPRPFRKSGRAAIAEVQIEVEG